MERMTTFRHLRGIILDWAGTTVDHGSLAPVEALRRVFAENGVEITAAEAREHMGVLKKDHIRSILSIDRVAREWSRVHGQGPGETHVERLFVEFLPRQSEILERFSEPIEGVPQATARWKQEGLRIGSTTGYTRALLEIVAAAAAKHGFKPEASVTPDEAGAGRPAPFMCYRNAIELRVYPLWACVKIGDTPSDIAEGLNAGMWTIGISRTGNEVGMSKADLDALPAADRADCERKARGRLRVAGAHYIAEAVPECDPFLLEIDRRLASGERP
jgi:phosphonoacetaldehyde hydrolase